jgi:hypothetical protein
MVQWDAGMKAAGEEARGLALVTRQAAITTLFTNSAIRATE